MQRVRQAEEQGCYGKQGRRKDHPSRARASTRRTGRRALTGLIRTRHRHTILRHPTLPRRTPSADLLLLPYQTASSMDPCVLCFCLFESLAV